MKFLTKRKINADYLDINSLTRKNRLDHLSLILQKANIVGNALIFNSDMTSQDIIDLADFCHNINFHDDALDEIYHDYHEHNIIPMSSHIFARIKSKALIKNLKKLNIIPDWKRSTADILEFVPPQMHLYIILRMIDRTLDCAKHDLNEYNYILTTNLVTAEHVKTKMKKELEYDIRIDNIGHNTCKIYYKPISNSRDIYFYMARQNDTDRNELIYERLAE